MRLHRFPLAAEPPPLDVIKAELSGMLAIRRAGLPPSLLSSLKHLASLHNPEFYSRQQIGLSVWGAPRMLRCYSESLDRLFLPRGVADRAAKLIEKAGSRLAITDLRSAPAELEPVIGEIPLFPGTEMAAPAPARAHPNPLPSRQGKSGRGRRKTVSTSPPGAAFAPRSGIGTTSRIQRNRRSITF